MPSSSQVPNDPGWWYLLRVQGKGYKAPAAWWVARDSLRESTPIEKSEVVAPKATWSLGYSCWKLLHSESGSKCTGHDFFLLGTRPVRPTREL